VNDLEKKEETNMETSTEAAKDLEKDADKTDEVNIEKGAENEEPDTIVTNEKMSDEQKTEEGDKKEKDSKSQSKHVPTKPKPKDKKDVLSFDKVKIERAKAKLRQQERRMRDDDNRRMRKLKVERDRQRQIMNKQMETARELRREKEAIRREREKLAQKDLIIERLEKDKIRLERELLAKVRLERERAELHTLTQMKREDEERRRATKRIYERSREDPYDDAKRALLDYDRFDERRADRREVVKSREERRYEDRHDREYYDKKDSERLRTSAAQSSSRSQGVSNSRITTAISSTDRALQRNGVSGGSRDWSGSGLSNPVGRQDQRWSQGIHQLRSPQNLLGTSMLQNTPGSQNFIANAAANIMMGVGLAGVRNEPRYDQYKTLSSSSTSANIRRY